jgi:hypothetical protein
MLDIDIGMGDVVTVEDAVAHLNGSALRGQS